VVGRSELAAGPREFLSGGEVIAERIAASDAPPPPPPPPPPDERKAALAPDVSPELADAWDSDPAESRSPGAPDLPRPEANPELHSAIADSRPQAEPLAEPRTRQEVAEEARAGTWPATGDTGELAPGRADGQAAAEADRPEAGRPDMAARYPADYVPASGPPPDVAGPHERPEAWAGGINPDNGDNNCGECARAVDSTWNGNPAAAAAMSDADAPGEPVARMAEWSGQEPTAASMSDVGRKLEELGPGSSAVVGCDWKDGGGHWFNAVNDGGAVKAVDGQSGSVEGWPPSPDGLGFDETDMRQSDAVFFTADGKVAKR
jgi:papain fold toxin 1 (glutamine deamidase) of polymorphic toxin system